VIWVAIGAVANGLAQFLQSYLHTAGLGDRKASALFLMYLAADVFAAGLMIALRGRISKLEACVGALLGIASYVGNYAVLQALGSVPGYVVFPLIAGGPVLIVAILSNVLFRERLPQRVKIGIGCGAAAIVLLTIG
jgi:drug/metabolite transporter (DMT)-like permease